MRVTSTGQVTIPQHVRERLGIAPGSEVEFQLDAGGARLVPAGHLDLVHEKTGGAKVAMSADEIPSLIHCHD
jgi:AbrB family looped-hinge helix DNA binding protein